MKLKTIHIDGFRCFDKFDASFTPGANVLIGRNGTGKSSLIHAIHKALSFIFSNDKSLGEDFLSAGSNFLKINSFENTDFYLDTKTRENKPEISISATSDYLGIPLSWELRMKTMGASSIYRSLYKDAFLMFMSMAKDKDNPWPLLAYYSDSFPHLNTKLGKSILETINNDIIPRNLGYYQWDSETACITLWETRMCNRLAKMQPLYTPASRVAASIKEYDDTGKPESELNQIEAYQKLKEEQKRIDDIFTPLYEETEFVSKRLATFIEKLPKVQGENYQIDYFTPISATDGYRLSLNFKSGKSLPFNELPAGYRRLYSIVFDIAYRSYILNGTNEPYGVVIIDEIDLHLHPALEQCVLYALQKTFPNIQFIVSTHSAAVIANLNTSIKVNGTDNPLNQILVMSEQKQHPEVLDNVFGVDYDSIIRDFMDSPSRNENLRKLEDDYLTYVSLGLEEESKSAYAKIKDLVGSDSKIIEAIDKKAEKYDVHK